MQTLIAVILIFSLLVAVHEWGHLFFAKRAGILCREFAIGFGPKMFSFKRNETVYTFRMLPLGGFVRMAGEDPETVTIKPGFELGLIMNNAGLVEKMIVNNKAKHPEAKIVSVERIDLEHQLKIEAYTEESEQLETFQVHEQAVIVQDEQETQIAPWHRQFGSKSPGKKAVAIFAGPAMNFVLAFILFVIFALVQGVPMNDAVIGEPLDDSPAAEAGLSAGDEVEAVDGVSVSTWQDMTQQIQQHPNEEITFTIAENGSTRDVVVHTDSRFNEVEEVEEGFIGAGQATEQSPLLAVQYGAEQVYMVSSLIFEVLGMIVTGSFSLDYLAGPVGIYDYTGEVADMGTFVLISWAAMLSVNLGIVNLLPLPALDGGRLMFIFLEAVRGKPLDPQKEGIVHFVGFALLMLLVLAVTWNDINRLFM
ncbi:regulator of sigma E protease [Salsuginibacillus halophilus]|uniref:Zinc metalloprotease n=1 Tax=Salsuginibacillus halophilus TaxID=517424 RepID=A0A2P8HYI6_9BACI|nr:RIP metalloprotease RseP [Salsuginibacillus halophilus]PSL51224.1 regulator of sigma E protease [Salsuginibacillus halophilus]